MIFSRVTPVKRALDGPFRLRVPSTEAEIRSYVELRYHVYGPEGMNLLPPSLHNAAGIEVDRFDKNAIPFACYQVREGTDLLVACLRLVTRERQEPYATLIRELIRACGEPGLAVEFEMPLRHAFPAEEYYDYCDEARRYLGAPAERVAELSRNIVRFGYRGYDLSRFIMEFGIAWSRRLGLRYMVAGCDPRHISMYSKYGYRALKLEPHRLRAKSPRIQEEQIFLLESFANPTCVLFADLRSLPELTEEHVKSFSPRVAESGETCICSESKCYQGGYPLLGTPECPLGVDSRRMER
jgi:hypothetical protein